MQYWRIKLISLFLITIVFSATMAVSAQTDQGSISYGDSVVGDLTTSDGDQWTFEGSEGDSVTIQLDSEAFDPFVELYSPAQTLLTSDDDSGGNFNSLINNFVLPSSGTFTILVRGFVGTARGEYTLSLTAGQSSDTGGRFSGGMLRYGETVNEDLNSAAGDRWTFEGTNGDLIAISLNSSDFDPYLELIGVDGAVLTSDDDGGNGLNSRISRFALPSTGTYTIIARGFNDTARGAYSLALTLMDNFVTGEISYNDTMAGDLRDSVGEFWAFEGNTGDFVTISISSDEFDTYVELLSPNGAQLAYNDDVDSDNRNSRLDRVQLPTDGTYLIVVRGYLDTARGEYSVTITSPNAPTSSTNEVTVAGSILYGDTVSGNLTTSGGDAWTFEGVSGEIVTVSVSSQVFDTYLVLQDSVGNELIADDNSGASLNALIEAFELPADDTYTVVARGVLSSDRGTYTLSLQTEEASEPVSGDNPISIGTVSRGIAVNGNVTTNAGDAWTFSGKSGEIITIAANSEVFNTYLELFDATGELIAFNDDSGPRLNALIESVALPADGEYTIVVRSFISNGRGDYSLHLQGDSPSTDADVVTVSDDFITVTLDTDPTALPNSVSISTVEVTTLQSDTAAYCVAVRLSTEGFTLLSPESIELGDVSNSEAHVAQFEVLINDGAGGQITVEIDWFEAQDCSGIPHVLTAADEITIVSETWQIGVDVYPSCSVEGEVIVSIIDTGGLTITQPQLATTEPYSTVFALPAEAGTYYAQANLFCLTSDGTQIPHVYSRLLQVDQDGQLFNVGVIDTPPDGE